MDLFLPAMGESISQATIGRWHKTVGERVHEGEPLLEVSTEKVDSDVPAPASGVLVEIICKAGDVVPVNARLGVIDTEAEGRVAAMTAQPKATPPKVHEVKPEKKTHPLPVPGAEVMSEDEDEGE